MGPTGLLYKIWIPKGFGKGKLHIILKLLNLEIGFPLIYHFRLLILIGDV